MDGNLVNQLMFLGWLSHGMAMPVADADGPFIISEITNKLVFGWTIVSSTFQDFAYCGTRELIFSNPVQKFFLLCHFIDRYVHIVGEGDGVKKVYMDGYLDNQLMFLDDFAYCGTRELIFSNPAQKFFLLCRFIDRYILIVGDGVKKVYMDGYLDNQLMLLRCLSHGMAMPVADANGPFIISEITNKLVFRWTIVSSSFQDFAYSGTRELIFSNPAQKHFLLCRFVDRYVQIVGEGDGVKKVYMDGYLDNQLMFPGWLSHGMAMPVANADGPFIISEITNKLILWWTIVSSSFQDFAYCGTRELIFSNPDRVKKVYMDGYLDNQLMLLGCLSHGMAMPVADANGPFIISEITNKLVFWWTILSSSFQDFAYSGTRELIFSNPAQKHFLLCCFIDRYVKIVGEGDGVKKVYMDGYLDNQLMLLGWLSPGMAMPVADADGRLLFLKLQTNSFLGDGVKKVYMDGYLDNQLMLLGWLSHEMALPVADADGPFIISEITNNLIFGWTIVYMDGYLDNTLMFLGWLSHRMAMPVAYADGPFIISEITNKLVFGWTIVSSSFQDFAY
ncbi:hypothetical protein CASFOL_022487 [Castilleja foliolosa]|uniref:Uncharacterized protein n=1 Tax=Castilleja foliolosa TaxID=1961234 RepID=A0ABD3CUR1_9LAMI